MMAEHAASQLWVGRNQTFIAETVKRGIQTENHALLTYDAQVFTGNISEGSMMSHGCIVFYSYTTEILKKSSVTTTGHGARCPNDPAWTEFYEQVLNGNTE